MLGISIHNVYHKIMCANIIVSFYILQIACRWTFKPTIPYSVQVNVLNALMTVWDLSVTDCSVEPVQQLQSALQLLCSNCGVLCRARAVTAECSVEPVQ